MVNSVCQLKFAAGTMNVPRWALSRLPEDVAMQIEKYAEPGEGIIKLRRKTVASDIQKIVEEKDGRNNQAKLNTNKIDILA